MNRKWWRTFVAMILVAAALALWACSAISSRDYLSSNAPATMNQLLAGAQQAIDIQRFDLAEAMLLRAQSVDSGDPRIASLTQLMNERKQWIGEHPAAALQMHPSNFEPTTPTTQPDAVRAPLISGPSEELWIIQRGPKADPQASTDTPGTGSLIIPNQKDPEKFIPVPLKHTAVKASIAGYIASVNVTQQFENPFSEKIEAAYVFPLPDDAGINEFVMTIGERHIRGIIRERAEAEKIYADAKAQGFVASLLTQERPNVFTQKVANIEPGKKIDISLTYYSPLAYDDGWYSFVFPMVVGPRDNPTGSTAGIGAAPRGAVGITGQPTELQYLAPAERSGHDISLDLTVDAGVPIAALNSPSHKIVPKNLPDGRTQISLTDTDTIPNKDFVLRYKVAADKTQPALLVHKNPDGKGGFFTLMLYPPTDMSSLPRKNIEMVFVVDTSGSMSGEPIAQAKAATKYGLTHLQNGDTFQVVQFDSDATLMSPKPLEWSDHNVADALAFVDRMGGNGGTEMLKGFNKALDFPHDPQRTRIVSFMTDGDIGNEAEILSAMREKLQDTRVFSIGVGSSPNRYLLDGIARLGHGAVAYLGLRDDAAAVMKSYLEKISHPAMTNIAVTFNGAKVSDVYPRSIPDLFVGKPVMITGRFEGTMDGPVEIAGIVGKEKNTLTARADQTKPADHPALATVWARMHLADLYDQALIKNEDAGSVEKDVKNVALEYGLMSPYTAYLAVDSTAKTSSDHGTTVVQPVLVPDGVRYETTVGAGH